jgi:catechol 2,3-dioxygenase-like lactoylglutathione lyase family enzyme
MRANAARVFVRDLARARHFYSDVLGLRPRWDGGSAIGYDVGIDLIVEQFADDEEDDAEHRTLVGRITGLCFAVDDIAAEYDKLRGKGVPFLGPPERMPWGGALAHFRDPESNVLTLVG